MSQNASDNEDGSPPFDVGENAAGPPACAFDVSVAPTAYVNTTNPPLISLSSGFEDPSLQDLTQPDPIPAPAAEPVIQAESFAPVVPTASHNRFASAAVAPLIDAAPAARSFDRRPPATPAGVLQRSVDLGGSPGTSQRGSQGPNHHWPYPGPWPAWGPWYPYTGYQGPSWGYPGQPVPSSTHPSMWQHSGGAQPLDLSGSRAARSFDVSNSAPRHRIGVSSSDVARGFPSTSRGLSGNSPTQVGTSPSRNLASSPRASSTCVSGSNPDSGYFRIPPIPPPRSSRRGDAFNSPSSAPEHSSLDLSSIPPAEDRSVGSAPSFEDLSYFPPQPASAPPVDDSLSASQAQIESSLFAKAQSFMDLLEKASPDSVIPAPRLLYDQAFDQNLARLGVPPSGSGPRRIRESPVVQAHLLGFHERCAGRKKLDPPLLEPEDGVPSYPRPLAVGSIPAKAKAPLEERKLLLRSETLPTGEIVPTQDDLSGQDPDYTPPKVIKCDASYLAHQAEAARLGLEVASGIDASISLLIESLSESSGPQSFSIRANPDPAGAWAAMHMLQSLLRDLVSLLVSVHGAHILLRRSLLLKDLKLPEPIKRGLHALPFSATSLFNGRLGPAITRENVRAREDLIARLARESSSSNRRSAPSQDGEQPKKKKPRSATSTSQAPPPPPLLPPLRLRLPLPNRGTGAAMISPEGPLRAIRARSRARVARRGVPLFSPKLTSWGQFGGDQVDSSTQLRPLSM